MKRAFTLIELMVVIGILGILMTIVVNAMAGNVRQARQHRASAACICVQQGLATYRAQKDKWPEPIGDGSSLGGQSNQEGANYQTDNNKYILDGTQVRRVCRELVDESKKGNPLMDISAFYVSRDSGEPGRRGIGCDFMEAIRERRIPLSELYFGYPDTATGHFRRFKIVYSRPTDEMKVGRQ